jgi:hypothetical protein
MAPVTLSTYLYSSANPETLSDPTGLCPDGRCHWTATTPDAFDGLPSGPNPASLGRTITHYHDGPDTLVTDVNTFGDSATLIVQVGAGVKAYLTGSSESSGLGGLVSASPLDVYLLAGVAAVSFVDAYANTQGSVGAKLGAAGRAVAGSAAHSIADVALVRGGFYIGDSLCGPGCGIAGAIGGQLIAILFFRSPTSDPGDNTMKMNPPAFDDVNGQLITPTFALGGNSGWMTGPGEPAPGANQAMP